MATGAVVGSTASKRKRTRRRSHTTSAELHVSVERFGPGPMKNVVERCPHCGCRGPVPTFRPFDPSYQCIRRVSYELAYGRKFPDLCQRTFTLRGDG